MAATCGDERRTATSHPVAVLAEVDRPKSVRPRSCSNPRTFGPYTDGWVRHAQELNEAQLASLTCLTDSEVATVTEEVEAVKRQTEQERARHQQVRLLPAH